jgi:hypothetical protein
MALHRRNYFFSSIHRADSPRDGCDVGIDIRQGFRSQAKKAHARPEDFADGLFLIGHRRNRQIGLSSHDLRCVGGPGVSQNHARTVSDRRHNVGAIPGTGHHAPKLANSVEDDGGARLQARDAAASARVGHGSS